MEENNDQYIYFKIVFNNQVIQMNYNTSFEEFKSKTIESLISEVLKIIGPKPLNTTPKDYTLYCPCGKILENNKLLSESKCNHLSQQEDFFKGKSKNEKYLLYKKEILEVNHEELSNEDKDKIFKKVFAENKKTKNEKQNINSKTSKQNNHIFALSNTLKYKIKECMKKKERGDRIDENGKSIYYFEHYYKELIEMGIDSNKAKAGLRYTNNNKGEAALMATDPEYNWNDQEYLFYDNNEVLSKDNFFSTCLNEIKKEYPYIENEGEINSRLIDIMNLINKNENEDNDGDNSNEEDNDNIYRSDSDISNDSNNFVFSI